MSLRQNCVPSFARVFPTDPAAGHSGSISGPSSRRSVRPRRLIVNLEGLGLAVVPAAQSPGNGTAFGDDEVFDLAEGPAWLGYDQAREPAAGRARRMASAPGPSFDLEPQGMAARHPPRRLARTPAGLPRRVRLPPQPAAHPDGRLADAARPRGAGRPPTARSPPDAPHRAKRMQEGRYRATGKFEGSRCLRIDQGKAW